MNATTPVTITPGTGSKPGRRLLLGLGILIVWLLLAIPVGWAALALYFDFPIPSLRLPIVIVFILTMALAFTFVKTRLWAMSVFVVGFLVVLGWWLTLRPSNDRAWQPDVAQ